MDLYVKNENSLWRLHEEIVKDIRTVLFEKGYTYGEAGQYDIFQIMSDRLIINNRRTDNISTDDLLRYLRHAYYVPPKFN